MRQRSVDPDFPDYDCFICDRGTGAQQFRGLVMSEIHRIHDVRMAQFVLKKEKNCPISRVRADPKT